MNFLEAILTEWLEYNGYFVRRNIKVGRRTYGGWDGELDVVALNPAQRHLIHYECSTDAWTRAKREARFGRKFELGRLHIPEMFPGLELPHLEQKVLHAYASKAQTHIGGVEVVRIERLISEIIHSLADCHPSKQAVPEQFPLLRTLQWASVVAPRKGSG